jgi:CHAT domain-containing protein
LNSAGDHLTSEQIAQLANRDRFEISDELTAESWRRAERHLVSCEFCQGLIESQRQVGLRLHSLKDLAATTAMGNCPSSAEWNELAAGIVAPERTPWLLDHAIGCDHCSELLRSATADLTGDVTSEDEDRLRELAVSRSDWQEHLAARLARQHSNLSRHGGGWWPSSGFALAGWAIAGVAFALLATVWVRERDSLDKVNRLLAHAYTEARPSDFRFAESGYAPVRLQRGDAREETPSLLEARVVLNRLRTPHVEDADFLLAQGRAELLEMNISSALPTLKRAHEMRPESTPILVDLAAAYGELADSGVTESYETALELLDEVQRQSPSDPIALYDRAILYERLQSYGSALQAWQSYLKKSPKGLWADEARKRAAEDEEKLKKENGTQNPESLLQALDRSTDAASLSSQEEEFLDAAASSWIEQARTKTKSDLILLAHFNAQWNQDDWLQDLLASAHTAAFDVAAEHLSAAVRENEASNHDVALADAKQAESEFAASQNSAGEIRAELEETYALQRSGHAQECLAEAARIALDARKRHYSWIETDSIIEQGNCASWLGNYGSAGEFLESADLLASQYRYPTLGLRVAGILAAVDGGRGATRSAWSRDLAGLSKYWSGSFPSNRAYQFYSGMTTLAEKSKDWCATSDFAREAAREAHSSPYRYAEAISEFRLAQGSANCGDEQAASLHYEASAKLFSQLAPTQTTRLYLLDAEVRKASLDANLHHAATALASLRALKAQISSVDPSEELLRYYNSLGKLSQDSGDLSDAGWAYSSAIETATHAAANLKTTSDRANWLQESAASYRGKVEVLLKQDEDESALDTWEAYRGSRWDRANASTHRLLENNSPAATSVRSNMPLLNNSTFVSYMRSSDGLNIWAYDANGIEYHHVTVPPNDVDQTVAHFIQLCSTPSSQESEISDAALKLYGWFIAPIEARISKSRLLIVEPDEPDWNLPFGALQNSNGKYLASELEIAQVSSFSDWVRLREARQISNGDPALFIANPAIDQRFAKEFPPLPETAAETSAIAGMFRHAQILSGSNANLQSVRTLLPRTALLYFGGHSSVAGQQIGLVLSGADSSNESPAIMSPGALPPGALEKLKIVVLASCSTAKKPDSGRNTESIAESFEFLGVPNVVATRWDVESETTSLFMQTFYSNLVSGKSVSASLRDAIQEIRSHSISSHPYYWAAFAVFGRG